MINRFPLVFIFKDKLFVSKVVQKDFYARVLLKDLIFQPIIFQTIVFI